MKNAFMISAALVVFASPAFATGAKPQSHAHAGASAQSVSVAAAKARATGGRASARAGDNSVSVSGDDMPAQAASAIAPALAATASCMGSSTFGAQGQLFGLSFGSTWEDETCQARENARAILTIGAIGGDATPYQHAARCVMAEASEEVADALARAGIPCE